jgi:hypothetical protein
MEVYKVKVLMNTHTNYNGFKKAGESYDVDDEVAKRWKEKGIASYVVEEDVDYHKFDARKLYALCKEMGLEVEPKQKKEVYIEALEAAAADEADEADEATGADEGKEE